jgi:UDP-N-acetylglucosamine--N-acetylmuramyl-(pentapeptide) pyrophosphoryl-undecaprenol N-acetylglucosamine transferase
MGNLMSVDKSVIIAAAGTGGHVFPGLAVAEELKQAGCHITWLGCHGLEKNWVEKSGFAFQAIDFSGIRGKGLFKLIKAPFLLWRAVNQAKKHLLEIKPKVVLTMGGYVSMPVGIAARLLGVPLVIHEQNAIAGLSNKLLHKIAQKTLVAFENALLPSIYTGNPVRMKLENLKTIEARYDDLGHESSQISSNIATAGLSSMSSITHMNSDIKKQRRLKLLVLGGSLGAQALNQIVPQAIALFNTQDRPIIVHQAGTKHLEQLKQNYQAAAVDAHTVDFIEKMQEAYEWADLVICRAGAMTVAELATVGVPSILVPYPHAVDDHQSKNAQMLVDAKAAWCIAQKQLTAETLHQLLSNVTLLDLKQMAYKAKLYSQDQAAQKVATVCLNYL